MKTCNACDQCKPLDAFSKRKDTRDGLAFKCKSCDNAYHAERYKQKPEQIKINAKRWAEQNPERKRQNYANWRAANREELLLRQREWWAENAIEQRRRQSEWRAANKERIAEKNAEWREKNPGAALALSRYRKAAKKQATPAWADLEKIKAIYDEAAAMKALGLDVHVDHYYPLRGKTVSGLHVHWNLQILLAEDNLKKRNRHPDIAA